jgi:hypothetical protein
MMMRTLFALFLLVATIVARSQNPTTEDFCQYQDQPIQRLLANLKTTVVDTRIGRTSTGTVRNLLLVFADSSYFEIFPVLNRSNNTERFNLKNYTAYKIKCLFYHVPGEVVDPCGCRSFAPSAHLLARRKQ